MAHHKHNSMRSFPMCVCVCVCQMSHFAHNAHAIDTAINFFSVIRIENLYSHAASDDDWLIQYRSWRYDYDFEISNNILVYEIMYDNNNVMIISMLSCNNNAACGYW